MTSKTLSIPQFCLIDDDSRTEAYTVLKPILDTYGIKGTFACITGKIGNENFLTQAQVIQMHSEGHEFVSHTVNHVNLTAITEAEAIGELKGSKDALDCLGIKTQTLVYPFGKYNDEVIALVKQYYACAVASGNAGNTPPLKPYQIKRVGIGAYGSTPIAFTTYKPYIDMAVAGGELLVMMTHIAVTDDAGIQALKDCIAYIQSFGYNIITFKEAYRRAMAYLLNQ